VDVSQVREVIENYKEDFKSKFLVQGEEISPIKDGDPLEHALWMIDNIPEFLDAKRIEKAMRWLGFVQGIFYTEGIYTIEEMKHHNKPK